MKTRKPAKRVQASRVQASRVAVDGRRNSNRLSLAEVRMTELNCSRPVVLMRLEHSPSSSSSVDCSVGNEERAGAGAMDMKCNHNTESTTSMGADMVDVHMRCSLLV